MAIVDVAMRCARPGKHPRTQLDIADATVDPEDIKRFWKKWPNAKIGIVMGWPGKLLALVTDGQAGRRTLQGIIAAHGKLPATPTIRHRDTRIYLFEVDGIPPSSRDFGDGVRIVGDADLIIAPSTLPGLNSQRRFANGRAPGQVKIAKAPNWMLKTSPTGSTVAPVKNFGEADLRQMTAAPAIPHTPQHEPSMVIVRASEIMPERVNWIWPGIIASGRVTGLAGYPGLGKSYVSIDIAATVSTGRNWPGGTNSSVGEVVILSAEDDAADTVVPRLIAAGADCTRIHFVKAVKDEDGAERVFNLAVDLDRLEREYNLRLVRLVVIDPVSAYLISAKGRPVNRNNSGDVRAVQGRLATFAARHDLGGPGSFASE
jgi:AAA domain/Bifunctional DNA primase/polymerase, N-terminal